MRSGEASSGTGGTGRGVLSGVQHHGRGGRSAAPRIRVAGFSLLTVHLLIVGCLTLRPLSVPWVKPANLQPLATIRPALEYGAGEALMRLGDGLLLLAPLGVLLPLATERLHRSLAGTLARTTVVGLLLSLGIALAQSAVPGHVVDVDTILLNTTGVALAVLLVFLPLRVLLRGRTVRDRGSLLLRDETAHGPPPKRARVKIAP